MDVSSATGGVSAQISNKSFEILSQGLKNAQAKEEDQTKLELVKSVAQPKSTGSLGSNIDIMA